MKNKENERWDKKLERVKGIEPSLEAWEAPVLPLNYTRVTKAEFNASDSYGQVIR